MFKYTMLAKFSTTGQRRAPLKQGQKMKKLLVVCSNNRQKPKCANLSLSCGLRHGIALECVQHGFFFPFFFVQPIKFSAVFFENFLKTHLRKLFANWTKKVVSLPIQIALHSILLSLFIAQILRVAHEIRADYNSKRSQSGASDKTSLSKNTVRPISNEETTNLTSDQLTS